MVSFVRKDYSWGRLKLTSDAFIQLLESEKVFTPYSNLVKRFGSKVKDDNNVRLSFHALLSTNAINGNHVPVCGVCRILVIFQMQWLIRQSKRNCATMFIMSKETEEIVAIPGLSDRPEFITK